MFVDQGNRLLVLQFPTPKLALLSVMERIESPFERVLAHAAYATRAQSQPARGIFRADFGPIGRVALRFEPNTRERFGRPGGCNGRRPIYESGRLRGTVSLEGEGGYFRLDSRGGPGGRERWPRLVCREGEARNVPPNLKLSELFSPDFGISPELEILTTGGNTQAVLNASEKVGGRSVRLRASRDADGSHSAVQVVTLEVGHGLAITRGLYVVGGEHTLRTSAPGVHPATATLAPPTPFYGEASYFENSARSHSWTGSLGVRLPGLDLALAGPSFATSLCVLDPQKNPRGCDFAKPKPLLPARLALLGS
jgi:hypothetical protein